MTRAATLARHPQIKTNSEKDRAARPLRRLGIIKFCVCTFFKRLLDRSRKSCRHSLSKFSRARLKTCLRRCLASRLSIIKITDRSTR